MSLGRPVIEGKGLRVIRGGAVIVDTPFIAVEEGEVLSLIGPNGSGKTTLLQTLSYLTKPFEGDLFFRGRKVGADCPVLTYRRALAMAFQEPLLFDRTVFENVASGLKIRGMSRAKLREAVMEGLALFGISALRDRSARSLSGGEAQRTSLARAFAIRPDVMLLDEPFASLDPRSREPLIEDMQAILKQTRTTTVFVTHDLIEAIRLSDRIAVMDQGRIRQVGSPEEVLNTPADEFVASFVGIGTILSGRVLESEGDTALVSVSGREIESSGHFSAGALVALFIRPENVTLSLPYDGGRRNDPQITSARNVFPGTVTRVIPMGFYQKIDLDCGFPLASYVTSLSREALNLAEGREVIVSFKATDVHLIKKP
ncbi:MAG: ABC transporter ATP-binding protein [Syntrophorhabdales bacterium]|jgi:tungstate transport system ATP-binding protein